MRALSKEKVRTLVLHTEPQDCPSYVTMERAEGGGQVTFRKNGLDIAVFFYNPDGYSHCLFDGGRRIAMTIYRETQSRRKALRAKL